jgi:hypothetical protein
MKHIKRVPIEKLGDYLEGTRQIAVVKDGKVIGHYVPRIKTQTATSNGKLDLSTVRPELRDNVQALESMLQETYERTGMTEDDLAEYMDPTLGCRCDDRTEADKSGDWQSMPVLSSPNPSAAEAPSSSPMSILSASSPRQHGPKWCTRSVGVSTR